MAGELINKEGAGGFVSIGSAMSLVQDSYVEAAVGTIAGVLSAADEDYPEFQARLTVTTGTPAAEGSIIEIHLRMGDGTNEEPAPAGSYAPHLIGSIVLDNSAPTSYFFANGLPILNKNSKIYLKNNDATTLTADLHIEARTVEPAP